MMVSLWIISMMTCRVKGYANVVILIDSPHFVFTFFMEMWCLMRYCHHKTKSRISCSLEILPL